MLGSSPNQRWNLNTFGGNVCIISLFYSGIYGNKYILDPRIDHCVLDISLAHFQFLHNTFAFSGSEASAFSLEDNQPGKKMSSTWLIFYLSNMSTLPYFHVFQGLKSEFKPSVY